MPFDPLAAKKSALQEILQMAGKAKLNGMFGPKSADPSADPAQGGTVSMVDVLGGSGADDSADPSAQGTPGELAAPTNEGSAPGAGPEGAGTLPADEGADGTSAMGVDPKMLMKLLQLMGG